MSANPDAAPLIRANKREVARTAPPSPPHVPVLGVPLALIDYAGTMEWIDRTVQANGRGYVCVAAVHTVMASHEDPGLAEAVRNSSLTVPDGQPLVWAMNALGHSLGDRVYGPELMARYLEHTRERPVRHFLWGGRNQGALVQLALNLRTQFPGVQIVGGYSPPYREPTADDDDRAVELINASGADVVWVGIGVPKQEKWMARLRDRIDAPVLIGVGAAFDFLGGQVPQAPAWMQDLGLEWAYRLLHEPRRLWKRYLRYNPMFVGAFARQYFGHRAGRPQLPYERADRDGA